MGPDCRREGGPPTRSPAQAGARATDLLARVGVAERASHRPAALSGGEQQLLEMAMAVLRRPEILLVDEPSVGLSPQAITLVFNELKRLHKGGRTILLVEQNTRKAMQAADRAVVLRLGKVIWDSPVTELSHEKLGELFMTGHPRHETSAG